MRYRCLATDYDGTLAHDGVVSPETEEALRRLRGSGRKLLLVTGREMSDLLKVFPAIGLFDLVVAENGALLYWPETKTEKPLAPAPQPEFVSALRERGVDPLAVGRAIVATWDNHRFAVLDAIQAMGLELQVIFNKGAVMVLPTGINKASGLVAALAELGLSVHNTVGIGDAENDHAFLSICECSAAVSNALPALKEKADIVTAGDHGKGVTEMIDGLLADDLAEVAPRLGRHDLPLGDRADGTPELLPAYGVNMLAAGHSGAGKSTLTTGLIERMSDRGLQYCIIDPEGDYTTMPEVLAMGAENEQPGAELVVKALEKVDANVNVNMIGVPFEKRPEHFLSIFSRLQELRSQTGRPHWVIIDEAHHVFPREWTLSAHLIPQDMRNVVLITTDPELLHNSIPPAVGIVAALGKDAADILRQFGALAGWTLSDDGLPPVTRGEALVWTTDHGPVHIRVAPCRTHRVRHARKYSAGELPPGREFFFRGANGKLNLRAQNLMMFLQMADGVDEETWLHHLRQHDYSQWFRESMKSDELAAEAQEIEADRSLSPAESRAAIRKAVESRFTLPG